MKQSVKLPYPPAILNPNKKAHWAKKAKAVKSYRRVCGFECMAQNIKPMAGKLTVKITISFPDHRRRDTDNAIASFKAGQDAVAKAIGVDDADWGVPEYTSARIDGWIKVELEGDSA